MAAVVGFWWFRDEEASFLDFLCTTGPLLAVPFHGV